MLDPTPALPPKRNRWSGPSGYREVLSVALPLVLSTGSVSVLHFVDRMFLSWHSSSAFEAAMPAGLFSFTIISFFLGTATYVNTFVAQYHGSNRTDRIGPSIWQAVYFSLVSGVLVFFLAPALAEPVFSRANHGAQVEANEIVYFRILVRGAGFILLSGVLSSFYSGRGKTWPIMWVHLGVTATNILLDWLWIFGHWGFAARGIEGAALATVASNAAGTVAFVVLFFTRGNRERFDTWRGWAPDRDLFVRLMRFGLPMGFQFMLDICAFTLFVLLVGGLGKRELYATNLTFQINLLVFLPMLGFGLATSTLVGRRIGEKRPDLAARATWSAFHMTVGYMLVFAFLYLAVPMWFIRPFGGETMVEGYKDKCGLAVVLLRFVAAYSIFDVMLVIFSSALKGAGDTRFVMVYSVLVAWCGLVLPTWLLCSNEGRGGIFTAWIIICVYLAILGTGFLARFLQGKWRHMRVIDVEAVESPSATIPPPSGGGTESW